MSQRNLITNIVTHLQLVQNELDDLSNTPLFTQKTKMLVKNFQEHLDEKLNYIVSRMSEEERSDYLLLVTEKLRLYEFIDSMSIDKQCSIVPIIKGIESGEVVMEE